MADGGDIVKYGRGADQNTAWYSGRLTSCYCNADISQNFGNTDGLADMSIEVQCVDTMLEIDFLLT